MHLPFIYLKNIYGVSTMLDIVLKSQGYSDEEKHVVSALVVLIV